MAGLGTAQQNVFKKQKEDVIPDGRRTCKDERRQLWRLEVEAEAPLRSPRSLALAARPLLGSPRSTPATAKGLSEHSVQLQPQMAAAVEAAAERQICLEAAAAEVAEEHQRIQQQVAVVVEEGHRCLLQLEAAAVAAVEEH